MLTLEQYEATVDILNLLENLGIKSAESSLSSFVETEGPSWTICSWCSEPNSDCRCDDAPNYYSQYGDEASFE